MDSYTIDPSQGVIVTFGIYALLVIYLFVKRPAPDKPFVIITGLSLVTSALYFGLISAVVLPFVIALIVTGILTGSKRRGLRHTSWAGLTLFSLAFALHIIPGFHNELIFHSEGIGVSNVPYWLYANLDKGIAGIIVLLFSMHCCRPFRSKEFFRKDFLIIPVLCLVIFGTGYLLGVPLDLKFGELTVAFIFFNLVVTCFAEEVFFRLLIQAKLMKFFPPRTYGHCFAIVASALLFTLAHFHTGEGAAQRLVLVFIAGLGYAFIFARSRFLLSAILCHFTVNLIHLTFFAYPAIFR